MAAVLLLLLTCDGKSLRRPCQPCNFKKDLLAFFVAIPHISGAAINTGVAFLNRGNLTLACAAGECTWGLFAVIIGAWPSAFMAFFSLGALAYREFSRFSYERQVGNAPA